MRIAEAREAAGRTLPDNSISQIATEGRRLDRQDENYERMNRVLCAGRRRREKMSGKTFAVARGRCTLPTRPRESIYAPVVRVCTRVGNVTYLSCVFTYRIDARRGRTFILSSVMPGLEFRCRLAAAWPRLDSTRLDSSRLESTRLDSARCGATRQNAGRSLCSFFIGSSQ